jgi:hypothetical protein
MGLYQRVLVPGDVGLLVGIGVGVALSLTSLTAEETVEVGADLVAAAVLDSVALLATGLEELSTLGRVAWKKQLISILVRFLFLQLFQFGFAHAESGREAVSVEARHCGDDDEE